MIASRKAAKVALVSDAGTPVISDPGHHLVALACGTTFRSSRFPALRR